MKIFISWSGERSRAVADLLDEWIQCVIQAVTPWMSSKDIDRGSLWFSEINDQLKDTSLGIVCLTQENKDNPWILFESGALAKGLNTNRVCTVLIDLQSSDIRDPLAQFNHTLPDRTGLWELVRTINNQLGERSLREKVLESVFDTYWPQFERGFAAALAEHPSSGQIEKRSEDELLVEILSTTRSLQRRFREIEKKEHMTSIKGKSDTNAMRAREYIKKLYDLDIEEDKIIEAVEAEYDSPKGWAKRYLDRITADQVSLFDDGEA